MTRTPIAESNGIVLWCEAVKTNKPSSGANWHLKKFFRLDKRSEQSVWLFTIAIYSFFIKVVQQYEKKNADAINFLSVNNEASSDPEV